MSEKKRIVELSDDALDSVSGGVVINQACVINSVTGQKYELLNPDRHAVFGYVCGLGDIPEEAKIAALQAAGFVGGEI